MVKMVLLMLVLLSWVDGRDIESSPYIEALDNFNLELEGKCNLRSCIIVPVMGPVGEQRQNQLSTQ